MNVINEERYEKHNSFLIAFENEKVVHFGSYAAEDILGKCSEELIH